MDRHQHVCGAAIEFELVAAGGQDPGIGIVAEILEEQEAVILVDNLDDRSAETEPDQVSVDSHERPHVLLRRRGVHDDRRGARPAQPIVGTERGIAGQQPLAGIAPAGAAHEVGTQPGAVLGTVRNRQSVHLPAA